LGIDYLAYGRLLGLVSGKFKMTFRSCQKWTTLEGGCHFAEAIAALDFSSSCSREGQYIQPIFPIKTILVGPAISLRQRHRFASDITSTRVVWSATSANG
jgi:hypothetical protein